MARFTFKKWFERFKPDEETTTILINGYTQINDPIYETDQIYPKAMNYYLIGAAVDKLAAYEDAEEQGRLHILPCNAGDSVYRINPGASDPIIEMMVQTIAIRHHATTGKSVCLFCRDLKDLNESFYLEKAFGKDVFFTIEEATQALQAMQEDKR